MKPQAQVQRAPAIERRKKSMGVCPNCSADLSQDIKTHRPYDSCPFCNTRILPIWWQRLAVILLGLFLAFAFPAWLGLAGWDVFFAGCLLYYPATVFAISWCLVRGHQNTCADANPLRPFFADRILGEVYERVGGRSPLRLRGRLQ